MALSRTLALTLLALAGAGRARGAISVDSAGVMGQANSPTDTLAFQAGSGADRVLLVGAASTGKARYFPVSSVSFGGLALTREAQSLFAGAVYQDVELWYALNVPAGTSATVTVAYPSTVESVIGAMECSGADPFVTFGAVTAGAAAASTLTTTLTTTRAGSWALLNCANYQVSGDFFVSDPTFTQYGWGGQSGGTIGLFQARLAAAPGAYSATTSYTDTSPEALIQQMVELVEVQATATASPTATPSPTASPTPSGPAPTARASATPAGGREFVSPEPFFPERPPLDRATFALPSTHGAVHLSILDLNFQVRWQGAFGPGSAVSWDGRDQRGVLLNSGVYLYLLDEDGQAARKGYLVLAR